MSEELNKFREAITGSLEREVAPYYDQWEKDGITPRSIWEKLGEAGFLCVDVDPEYGGAGADFEWSVEVVQMMARMGYGALATNVSVHSDIVTPYIAHLGTEAQKQYWLPRLASGHAVGAIAMTEPGAGSDLQGMSTQAIAQEDGQFLVRGQKTFITNGQHGDVCIVAAKSDPSAGAKGISLFLLDKSQPGYRLGSNFEKLGQHCGDTSELFFDDVISDQVLGTLHRGFMHLMDELPRERLVLAATAIAACEGMLEWTLDYVKERKAFGQAIGAFQNTRFKLAELATQIKVNRAFIQTCIQQYNLGQLDTATASQAKLSCTELQFRVADECLQLFGGYGYMMEYPISRAFADARVQRIYGGTSEVMKEIIARDILGK